MPVYGLKTLKGWIYDPITKRMIPPTRPINADAPEDGKKVDRVYVSNGGKFKIEYEEEQE